MSKEFIKRILSSIIILPLFLFLVIKGSIYFLFLLIICLIISIFEWFKISKIGHFRFYGLFFLFFSFYTIYILRINYNDYLLFLFISTISISTDVGGYIFGKLFKGPKLTKFSPNKTYAGMMGGYILSLFSLFIFFYFNLIINNSFLHSTIFVVLVSTISQIGDIIISYFKRISKIKDTGKIIPGHGGLLDRIDGMIFAFPFSYLIITLNLFKTPL